MFYQALRLSALSTPAVSKVIVISISGFQALVVLNESNYQILFIFLTVHKLLACRYVSPLP